jgi:hypothetical protein
MQQATKLNLIPLPLAAKMLGESCFPLRNALDRGYIAYYWIDVGGGRRKIYFSPEQLEAYKRNQSYRRARGRRFNSQARAN